MEHLHKLLEHKIERLTVTDVLEAHQIYASRSIMEIFEVATRITPSVDLECLPCCLRWNNQNIT